jgi:integrase
VGLGEFADNTIRVHEQLGSDSTKGGEPRNVEMARALSEALRSLLARRREEAFKRGEPISPHVVFEKPRTSTPKNLQRTMARRLKRAGLPGHFTCHSLRHTFASLLIAPGVSPVYVQQQLGHASIELTVKVTGATSRSRLRGWISSPRRPAGAKW